MDERIRKAIALLREAAVEARRSHESQLVHLDNLVAVADALEELAQEQGKALRVVS